MSGRNIKFSNFIWGFLTVTAFVGSEPNTCGGKTCLHYLQCSMDAVMLKPGAQSTVLSAFREAGLQLKCDKVAHETTAINDCLAIISSRNLQYRLSLHDFQLPSKKFFWAKDQTGNFTWGRSQCALTPGGSLAKLDTMVEANILACVTKRTFGIFFRYGLGLIYSGEPNQTNKENWNWSDGSKVGLDKWRVGEPSNHLLEYCGSCLTSHDWTNLPCDTSVRPSCYVNMDNRAGPIRNDELPTIPSTAEELFEFENRLQAFFHSAEWSSPFRLAYNETEVYVERLQAAEGRFEKTVELRHTGLDFDFRAGTSSEVTVAIFEVAANASSNDTFTSVVEQETVSGRSHVLLLPSYRVYTGVTVYDASSNRTLCGTFTQRRNVTSFERSAYEFLKSNWDPLQGKSFESVQATCAFIEPSSGKFSTVGCQSETVGDQLICTCNHLTIFSVLLAVSMVDISLGVKIVSYICGSLSVVFLMLTLALLVIYRKDIGSDRTVLQINLSVALFMLHITSLTHEGALKHSSGCLAFAVITHFFLLATCCWFLIDGVRIVMATQFPTNFRAQNPSKRTKAFLVVGWSLPTLITFLTFGVGWHFDIYVKPSSYYLQFHQLDDQIQKYDRCWLAPGSNLFVLSVMIPVGTFVGTSFIFALVSASVLLRKRPGANEVGLQETKEAIAKFFFLILLLGGTWILGFFAGVNEATSSLIFQYVHTVANGLQGVFVFYFYCFLNSTIREKLRLFMRKRRQRVEEPPIPMVPINRRTQETDM